MIREILVHFPYLPQARVMFLSLHHQYFRRKGKSQKNGKNVEIEEYPFCIK